MKTIIVSILFLTLVGCGLFSKKPDPPVVDKDSVEEIAKQKIKPDTSLPVPLDLDDNKLHNLKYTSKTVTITEIEFEKIQDLLLRMKNRIFELQEKIKDFNK